MLSNEILDQIYRNNQNSVEERINKQYHERINKIKSTTLEERESIKQGIIAELYYKEGFKDGLEFALDILKKS